MASDDVASKSKTSFLDLPGELRNRMYQIMLVSATQLRMIDWFYGRFKTSWFFFATSGGRTRFEPTLLLVSRMTNAEATAMLYGANQFFISLAVLSRFTHQIGSCRRHIRHLSISNVYEGRYFSWWNYKQAFDQLISATDLRSLTIAGSSLPVKCFMNCAIDWALGLREARKFRAGLDPLKIIHFAEDEDEHPVWPLSIPAAEFQARVRKGLAEVMDTRAKLRRRSEAEYYE
ncbi:hypothetical protein Slin14017_G085070 [Septoria linicola]|nr:hypothetical protein Slin14017_G085070 [Septoria linicola]